MPPQTLYAESALLPEGWARDVLFEIGPDGALLSVTPDAKPGDAPRAAGPVLPGMGNLHSHAFQRAMAGLTERAGPAEDSFWTWRELMYGFVGKLTPDQVQAIASQLYVEMLKAGYTAVGEFHYLHHDPKGAAYADPAEMSKRVIAAAKATGIGITHLPVLYGYSDFGGKPAHEGQRRFLHAPDAYLKLVESLIAAHRGDPQVRIGIAPHSLRAVTPETLEAAVAGLTALDDAAPVHIHIAEQRKEVRDCIAGCGDRPVEWLRHHALPDERWCLMHATHVTEEEATRLAACRAVAGLCPTTEANLGDGIFPAQAYLAAGGVLGIGSDSHISVSPVEELRWLEYAQRLTLRRRNILGGGPQAPHVGVNLYRQALAGGAQALARPIGRLAPGCRADLIVLDASVPTLVGKSGDALLDSYIFAGNLNPVRDVMAGGAWVVGEGRHAKEEAIAQTYAEVLSALLPG